MEVGEEGFYAAIATLCDDQNKMTPALSWAARRAILVSLIARGKVARQCLQTTTF